MVVYKVLKWKFEIDFPFFLTLFLFNLLINGKRILHNPEDLTSWIKGFVIKTSYIIKNHFENFR